MFQAHSGGHERWWSFDVPGDQHNPHTIQFWKEDRIWRVKSNAYLHNDGLVYTNLTKLRPGNLSDQIALIEKYGEEIATAIIKRFLTT